VKKIKPVVEEISLAFNPASGKSFFMKKEEEVGMKDLVEILESATKLEKEEEVTKFLGALIKAKEISEKAANAVRGALKLLNKYKGELPKGIFSSLSKLIPEYGQYAAPAETADEKKAKEDALTAKIKKESEDQSVGDDLKKELSDMKKEISDLKKETADAKALAEKESRLRRNLEIRVAFEKDNTPGDIEKMTRVLQSLEDINPELAKDYSSVIKEFSTMLKATGVFGEIGGSGGSGGSDQVPYEKMRKMVEERLTKDTSITPAKAWKDVIRDNPTLYKEYLDGKK